MEEETRFVTRRHLTNKQIYIYSKSINKLNMIYIFIFILAGATGKIGEATGGSFWLWFLIGLFTGGFGLIAAVIYYLLTQKRA